MGWQEWSRHRTSHYYRFDAERVCIQKRVVERKLRILNEEASMIYRKKTASRARAHCLLLLVMLISVMILICLQPTRSNLGIVNCEQQPIEEAKALPYAAPNRERIGEHGRRIRRSPLAGLLPINELRVSGSKSEPPSRPSQDWSKQRPYFGQDMARNLSVELGKTAYLTCKVYELGDKTVSWLRPRENEILTSGRYTYVGDSRFASINDNGSHEWILEIKDVGINDSTNYECQVNTDPKMSAIINLQVKAAKAKIKQGEQYYAPMGSNIEFSCEANYRPSSSSGSTATNMGPLFNGPLQQTYWYFNGNLLNYARSQSFNKNFSIDWDSMTQTSKFKIFNVQLHDAGNYSCKPTSAEPATIRLHVKRFNQKARFKDSAHFNSYGSPAANNKEGQSTRQQYSLDSNGNFIEAISSSNSALRLNFTNLSSQVALLLGYLSLIILLLTPHRQSPSTQMH